MTAPAWTVEVDHGEGWTDITGAVGSTGGRRISRTRTMHKRLKSAVNTCRLRVHDPEPIRQIAAQDTDVQVRVMRDGATWFRGLLRDRISETYGSRLRSARLEAVDASYRLQELVDTDLAIDGADVCDPQDTASSLLHQLLTTAGIPAADLSLQIAVPQTITRYGHDRKSDTEWRKLVDELLGEYGYVLDVDPSGTWRMLDLFPASVTTVDRLTDDHLERRGATIQRRRTPARYNAVRVDWHPHKTLDDQVLFRLTQGGDEETGCRVPVAASAWYPPGTDTNDVWSIWKAGDGYELIAAVGLSWTWDSEGEMHERTRTLQQTRGLLELQAGAAPATITQFEVTGRTIVRDTLDLKRTIAYRETGTRRIESITTKWILADSWASRLASGRATWYEHGSWSYQWDAEAGLFDVGQVWELDSDLLDHHGLVRVVTVTEDEWGRQRVMAEGVPGTV